MTDLPGTDLRKDSSMDSGYSGLAAAIVISALKDVGRYAVAVEQSGKKLEKLAKKRQSAMEYLLSSEASIFVSAAGITGPLTEETIEKAAKDLRASWNQGRVEK